MKIRCLLALALVLIMSVAYAHEDRILTIRPDDTIPEIPASFGHVSLRISGLGGPAPAVEFSSGSHHNKLPLCVTRLIRTQQRRNVFVTGSWYHDTSKFPPYIYVRFYAPGYAENRPFNSSFDIAFNLYNARVTRIERFVAYPAGNGGEYRDVVLPKGCTLP